MDAKKKKLITILAIALVVVCIICYSLYIFTPEKMEIPEGATMDKISIHYIQGWVGQTYGYDVEFDPKEVPELSKLLKEVKIYPMNLFAYKENLDGVAGTYNIRVTIQLTLPEGYEGTKKDSRNWRQFEVQANYVQTSGVKPKVIHPFVTKEQHLEFYNQLLEYKDNPFGTVIEEEN